MANFVQESFTGTAGANLNTLSGWVRHTASDVNSIVISDANRGRPNSAAGVTYYYNSASPNSADYSVSVDVIIKSSNGTSNVAGVQGRMDTSATTWYSAYLQDNGVANQAVMHLTRSLAGVTIDVATVSAAFTANVNDVFTIKLEMIGTTINAYKNGALFMTGTNGDVSSAGKAGVLAFSSSTGDASSWHIDNFSGDDIVSGTVLEEDGEWIITTQSW